MDRFFFQKFCDRCGGSLEQGRTMSMFNTECICMQCSDKEKQEKDFEKAVNAEHEEIKKGNYNYKGIRD
jgi:hypothetical protein